MGPAQTRSVCLRQVAYEYSLSSCSAAVLTHDTAYLRSAHAACDPNNETSGGLWSHTEELPEQAWWSNGSSPSNPKAGHNLRRLSPTHLLIVSGTYA